MDVVLLKMKMIVQDLYEIYFSLKINFCFYIRKVYKILSIHNFVARWAPLESSDFFYSLSLKLALICMYFYIFACICKAEHLFWLSFLFVFIDY